MMILPYALGICMVAITCRLVTALSCDDNARLFYYKSKQIKQSFWLVSFM